MSPLVPLSACWLAGLLVAAWSPVLPGSWGAPLALSCAALGLGLAAFGLLPAGPPTARRWMIWAACGAALLAGSSVAPGRRGAAHSLPPRGIARIEGEVLDSRAGGEHGDRSFVVVRRGQRVGDGTPIARGTVLSVRPIGLPVGARVQLLGKLRPSQPFRNPSPHPRAPPRFAATGKLWLPGPDAVEVRDQPFGRAALERARRRVRARLVQTLPHDVAGIARALLLGDADAVAREDREHLRASGLSHVLAVSGLHVTLVAGLCVALVRRVLLYAAPIATRFEARRIACAIGVPVALGYAAFAGGAPSAWRAALTAAVTWSLAAGGVPASASASAALSALLLSATAPDEAARPAFLLSIVATAALLSGRSPVARDLTSALRAGLVASARTTVATAPIVLWCFGAVPVVGLLANVILVPIGSLCVVPLAVTHGVAALTFSSPSLSARLLTLASRGFVEACAVFARAAPSGLWPPPSVPQGVVLAAACAALLALGGLRKRLIAVLIAGLLLGALELDLRANEQPLGRLRVTYFDVGQGDAALVDLPDRRAMLIDAGGSPHGGADPGELALLPVLRARRRDRIDIAVLSHPHPDHYGGMAALSEQVAIGELWDSGQAEAERALSPTAAEAADLIDRMRARGTRVRQPGELCAAPLRAGDAVVRVLAPCPRYDSSYDANDNSLVVRIDFRGRSALFVGDAERHAERVLLSEQAPLQAELLKVGHHGSRTSSSDAFLSRVRPLLAVISSGVGNQFGHPHRVVVQRLRHRADHTLLLARSGGVIAETEGDAWRVRSFAGERLTLEGRTLTAARRGRSAQ